MSQPQESNPDDINLSDEELSKIFLGAESDSDIKKSVELESVVQKPKIHKPTMEELEAQLTPKRKSNAGRKKKEIPEGEKKEEKRPHGRPKVWTDQKIIELKIERKKAAAERAREKSEQTQMSKISTGEPLSLAVKKNILDQNIKTKEEIEKHFLDNRTFIKEALEKKANSFIYQRSQCKGHKYKLNYFENGEVVSDCIYCSVIKRCNMREWDCLKEKV